MCASTVVVSIDPFSCVVDCLLKNCKDMMPVKWKAQNYGVQIKPCTITLLEEGTWEEGDPEVPWP